LETKCGLNFLFELKLRGRNIILYRLHISRFLKPEVNYPFYLRIGGELQDN